ncbi:MAG: ABC transporter ATP-binding protein [Clostridia bacterium]|nr:ABC transporter ATP-binding protein [Clostridia bacterium]
MQAIKTVNLTKKYKDTIAVDKLNLEIEQGEIFALLGVNGAGKTTVIKMLCGLTEPTDGEGFILGNSITQNSGKIKCLIGVSPQETAVAPNLSVKENLQLLCGLYGFSKEKQQEKIRELTERFRLQEIFLKRAKALSGGWQRRVSIAMALIGEPSVLFLDEPTLGLDVIARRELWEIIRSLKGKSTIILTTHYLEEAEALADKIGVMKQGKLIAMGTARALMERTGADNFEDAFISIVKEGQV